MGRFDTISEAAILDGTATDAYFQRTESALNHAGRNPHVVAEITADQFGEGEDFEVFAGVKDVATLLEELDITVDALREGQLFDGGPVMRIEGPYLEFARYETALLGFLSHASGIATAALEARQAAPESAMLSFGARHVHPTLGAVVERNALLGGAGGFSHVAAGEILNRDASGTMPHALMLCFGRGNQQEAWNAFNEGVDADTPRIALCDTFDEIAEVTEAVEVFGDDLDGVRLDTTSSRRGDFRHIIKEVRYKLRELGRDDVDIYVSGGLGPTDMRELRDVVDGFGIGGYISNADPVDFSLDIVEVDGAPISKRGKLEGVKEVYRTDDGGHRVISKTRTQPEHEHEPLLKPLIDEGSIVREFNLDDAADRAQRDADAVGFPHTE